MQRGKNVGSDESDASVRTPVADARVSSNCFIASCPARIMLSRYPCASADGLIADSKIAAVTIDYPNDGVTRNFASKHRPNSVGSA
jgi:hypothetical protein